MLPLDSIYEKLSLKSGIVEGPQFGVVELSFAHLKKTFELQPSQFNHYI